MGSEKLFPKVTDFFTTIFWVFSQFAIDYLLTRPEIDHLRSGFLKVFYSNSKMEGKQKLFSKIKSGDRKSYEIKS